MRCALISDVHANLEALQAVLEAVRAEGVDGIACLGDWVGYNASPNECVALAREAGIQSVAGNHDRVAAGLEEPADFGRRARSAILWTRSALTDESRRYLAALPLVARLGGEAVLVHAALHPRPDVHLHLSTTARIARSFDALRAGYEGRTIGFFGHTHRPGVYARGADGLVRRLGGDADEELELSPGAHYLVNPGSVGQPRDRDARASFVVFDARLRRLRFRRIAFDVERALERTRAAGLEPYGASEASEASEAPPRRRPVRVASEWLSERVSRMRWASSTKTPS